MYIEIICGEKKNKMNLTDIFLNMFHNFQRFQINQYIYSVW